MRLRGCVAAVMLALAVAAPARAAVWQPLPNATWQIQFSGTFEKKAVDVYDLDMFGTSAATVADLHADGAKVICYIDAGSWERWRPDAKRFPAPVLGRPLAGWPGERWLDVRKLATLGPLLKARVKKCASKGFDAVDFDNVDGFQNRTAFPLTGRDQLRFNRFLAALAHNAGLGAGLKNDVGQIGKLVDNFDFAVNEQCFHFAECDRLKPFIDANKAVFHIEYTGDINTICATTKPMQLSTLKKHLNLDAYAEPCP